MFKAFVYITLKESVLDPQGKAVEESLYSLGYDEVNDVRIGKQIELTINLEDKNIAEERVKEMCEKLLANTVIENYRYQLEEVNR